MEIHRVRVFIIVQWYTFSPTICKERARQVAILAGPQEPLAATVKRRMMMWFGHVTRHNTLAKKEAKGEADQERAGQKTSSSRQPYIETPALLPHADDRPRWRRLPSSASPSRPSYAQIGHGTEVMTMGTAPMAFLHYHSLSTTATIIINNDKDNNQQ